jgi:hypothetical protein
MADSEPVNSTVLDRLVPSFQAAERHATTIAASADQVWAALAQVTVGELGLFRRLMSLRALPGRLLGRPPARFDADVPLLGGRLAACPPRRRQGHPAQYRDAGGLHRCRLGSSLGPLLVADPPGQRGGPSQLAGGDQAPRRTIWRRRSQPR